MTSEERIVCQKVFLANNWELVAAYAWERYQAKGRGAVVVPEEDIISMGMPKLARIRFGYMAGSETLLKALKAKPGDKEDRWLADYDPDAKVVLVVVSATGASSYLAGGSPKPSECHARQKASHN